jgi:hypothetical protein
MVPVSFKSWGWVEVLGKELQENLVQQKTPHFSVRGFANLALLVAYTPVRPAPVGEVIRTTTTRFSTAGRAVCEVLVRGVWRCNMQQEKHVGGKLVKQACKIFCNVPMTGASVH